MATTNWPFPSGDWFLTFDSLEWLSSLPFAEIYANHALLLGKDTLSEIDRQQALLNYIFRNAEIKKD